MDQVEASAAEIEYLCEGVNRYFEQSITSADVVWTYAGVRPLVDDGSGKPEAATRGYRLDLSSESEGAPLLSVYGGKITSYRHLAEAAVDMLVPNLPALTGQEWTATQPLPGGDFATSGIGDLVADLRADHPFLAENEALRIARAYGTRASVWLGEAKERVDLGRDFGEGLSQAEVDYLRCHEWALTVEDVLWRRSKLGLRLDASQQDELKNYLGN